jgi:EmrB/QacA subfamily drug resistance transporter
MSTTDTDTLDPRVWRVAAVVFVGPFMTQIDSTVVNVSLSSIGDALHATIATTQWVISGYLLALALMLPLNGWFVDRFGAKRLYIACFSAFTLASLLCGAAQSIEQLICARMLQGITGGLLVPMAQMMIARVAGKHMARVLGYTVVPVLIAPILGPVIAGLILKHGSWPWLFYLNLPVGIVGVVLASFLLPSDYAFTQPRRFDLMGFLLISPGLACVLFGLQQVAHGHGVSMLITGIGLMAAFIWHAIRKNGAALIDLRLFKNKIFSAAATTQFFSNGVFFGRQFLVPLYLIVGCALSASQAGWMMSAMGVGMMCSFPMVGYLTGRFGCRAVSVGGALVALLAMLPYLWMITFHLEPVLATVCLFFAGAGQGTISIPSVSAAYASVAKEKIPAANTAINIVQRLGGPIVTTVSAIMMSANATNQTPGPQAFIFAFGMMMVLHVLVLVAASQLPVLIHTPPEREEQKTA